MLATVETEEKAQESRAWRLARKLARRRAVIFAPLFVLALALAALRPTPVPRPALLAALAVLHASWLLRLWATGYRSWVHKDGVDRYLMTAGPYARLRHPLYLANGVAGAASLVALGQLELLAVYVPAFLLVTACIVRREEEALATRFGADHAAYAAGVPAFLPLPGRCVPAAERQGSFSWEPVRRSLEVWKLAVLVAISVALLVRT